MAEVLKANISSGKKQTKTLMRNLDSSGSRLSKKVHLSKKDFFIFEAKKRQKMTANKLY